MTAIPVDPADDGDQPPAAPGRPAAAPGARPLGLVRSAGTPAPNAADRAAPARQGWPRSLALEAAALRAGSKAYPSASSAEASDDAAKGATRPRGKGGRKRPDDRRLTRRNSHAFFRDYDGHRFPRQAPSSKQNFSPAKKPRSKIPPSKLNRAAIRDEIPTDLVAAFEQLAAMSLIDWKATARLLIVQRAVEILRLADAGWNATAYRALLSHPSPAIRVTAVTMRNVALTGKSWGAGDIVVKLQHHFGVIGGHKALRTEVLASIGQNLPGRLGRKR